MATESISASFLSKSLTNSHFNGLQKVQDKSKCYLHIDVFVAALVALFFPSESSSTHFSRETSLLFRLSGPGVSAFPHCAPLQPHVYPQPPQATSLYNHLLALVVGKWISFCGHPFFLLLLIYSPLSPICFTHWNLTYLNYK